MYNNTGPHFAYWGVSWPLTLEDIQLCGEGCLKHAHRYVI